MKKEKMKKINGDLEYQVISEIALLRGKGYAVPVARSVSEKNGKRVQLGSIHAILTRLEDKGFVKSKLSEPVAERGGRPRRLYTVTASGERAISEREALVRRVYGKPLGLGAAIRDFCSDHLGSAGVR